MDSNWLYAARQVNRRFYEHYLYEVVAPNKAPDAIRISNEYVWYHWVFLPFRQQVFEMRGIELPNV